MNTTTTWTETQIRNAARKIARKATALRRQGKHEEAEELVQAASRNVDALRRAGAVG